MFSPTYIMCFFFCATNGVEMYWRILSIHDYGSNEELEGHVSSSIVLYIVIMFSSSDYIKQVEKKAISEKKKKKSLVTNIWKVRIQTN